MLDPLDIAGIETTARDTSTGQNIFKAKALTSGVSCHKCNGDRVHRHDKNIKRIRDTPFAGMPTVIDIERDRFKCQHCGQTFNTPLQSGFDSRHHATRRLVRYIEEQSLNRTFAELSREVGLDEATVSRIANRFIKHLDELNDSLPQSALGVATVSILRAP